VPWTTSSPFLWAGQSRPLLRLHLPSAVCAHCQLDLYRPGETSFCGIQFLHQRRLPWQQVIAGLFVLAIIILIPIGLSGSQHSTPAAGPVYVKILAVNDFHGQLPEGQKLNKIPAGSVPVLASYLHAAQVPLERQRS